MAAAIKLPYDGRFACDLGTMN